MGGDAQKRAVGPATGRLRGRALRADANPELVATARFIRSLLPGEEGRADTLSTSGQLRRRLESHLSSVSEERPSAMRELGLGALSASQALS